MGEAAGWERYARWAVLGCWAVVLLGPLGLNRTGWWPAAPAALSWATGGAALLTLLAALRRGRPRAERVGWLLVGTGLVGYATGFILQFYAPRWQDAGPYDVNASDCASLLLYPLGYALLALLARSRAGSRDAPRCSKPRSFSAAPPPPRWPACGPLHRWPTARSPWRSSRPPTP